MKTTEKALEQLKKIKKEKNKFTRLVLKGSGCAGFSYKFELADKKEDFEVVIEDVLLVDEFLLSMLKNSTINYRDDDFEKHLYLQIPDAKSVCGCKKSFSL